jgi:hypothetical protein
MSDEIAVATCKAYKSNDIEYCSKGIKEEVVSSNCRDMVYFMRAAKNKDRKIPNGINNYFTYAMAGIYFDNSKSCSALLKTPLEYGLNRYCSDNSEKEAE